MKATFFVAAAIVVSFAIWPGTLLAWEGGLYVDSTCGSDANPGTATRPLMTLKRAAMLVNQSSKAAPATIRLAPGIYNLDRTGADLKDLVVTQCVFIGDRNGLDIYCPVIGAGGELIVDHCVFLNCHASAVFWDGPKGIVGKRNMSPSWE